MAVQSVNNPNVTPAVRFDDIPGHLPKGSIPVDADYDSVADNAITQLNNLKPDDFTNNVIWRDLFVLTHTLRTFNSQEAVYTTLMRLCEEKKVSRFERTSSTPCFSGLNWIDVDFKFKTQYQDLKAPAAADQEQVSIPNKIARDMTNGVVQSLIKTHSARFDALEDVGFKVDRAGDLFSCLFERFGGHYIDHGGSVRIAKGDIKVQSKPVKGLYREGLEFEDGSRIPADLIVLATGFSHDFRAQAAKLIGTEAASKMDEFGGLDKQGEMRGFARLSGHPNLYYHGFEVRASRYYSRFIGLAIQADVLGRPLQPYMD